MLARRLGWLRRRTAPRKRRAASDTVGSALIIWGRHDAFFDIAETLSWMKALPRMESHILDGPHFLLETHAGKAARLMSDFLERNLPHEVRRE